VGLVTFQTVDTVQRAVEVLTAQCRARLMTAQTHRAVIRFKQGAPITGVGQMTGGALPFGKRWVAFTRLLVNIVMTGQTQLGHGAF